jgi:hypothetical protein
MNGASRFPHLWLEGANEEHPLRADMGRAFVAGRADNTDLRLADPGCSRRQFQLSPHDGRWWIEGLSAAVPGENESQKTSIEPITWRIISQSVHSR